MKGILLLNGQPQRDCRAPEGARVYCCDGAYEWAKDDFEIYKNIGDFDSLGYAPVPKPEKIYPTEKDMTDGEIAVREMMRDGVDDIEIFGGGGGRPDHFLGNLQLLRLCAENGVTARMYVDESVVTCFTGEMKIVGPVGSTVSVLPFGGSVRIEGSGGLKYPYPSTLEYASSRGLSNVIEEEGAYVRTAVGDYALCILSPTVIESRKMRTGSDAFAESKKESANPTTGGQVDKGTDV